MLRISGGPQLIKVNRDYYEYFTKDMNLPDPIYTRGKKWVVVPSLHVGKYVYIVPFVQTDAESSSINIDRIVIDNSRCKKFWDCSRIKFEDSIFTFANTLLVDCMFPAIEGKMIWTKRNPTSDVADKARKVISDIKLNDLKVGFVQYYCFGRYMTSEKLFDVLRRIVLRLYIMNNKKYKELESTASQYIRKYSVKNKINSEN